MPDAKDQRLLEDLLDSWDRNNTILVNLLRALPEGGLEARAMEGSSSIAEMVTHIHYVRLVFVLEDAEGELQNCAERGNIRDGASQGHETSLRLPVPYAPAHDLA